MIHQSDSHIPTESPSTIFSPFGTRPHSSIERPQKKLSPLALMEAHRKLLFNFFCFFLTLLLSGTTVVYGSSLHHHHHHHGNRHLFHFRPRKLFVFGDSYADTGNNRKSLASSWKVPYGITFPGKPAGRFSDGRVLTDYLARFIGVKSPIPYRWRNVGVDHLKYGMNFAYGGTGVFDTLTPQPNMTTQIDFFQQVINEKVYTPADIQSSVALVTCSGNDYSTYLATNGSTQGFPAFITQVVNQFTVDLKRIQGMGLKKVALTALQPLGCLPRSSFSSSFRQCNATQNQLVAFHNLLLNQAVAKLNNETSEGPTFVVLDLYTAFMTVLKNKGEIPGSTKFENPLKPCCMGVSTAYSCGSVDTNGTKMYTVCQDPESSFFWDNVHPTQEGWKSVYSALKSNLAQL